MAVTTDSLPSTDPGGRILKVDHAGEHGAVNIYTGQIFAARLTAPDMIDELPEFLAHEKRHRAIFGLELERRGRRRCRSYSAASAKTGAFWPKVLTPVVSAATELVIWTGMRM